MLHQAQQKRQLQAHHKFDVVIKVPVIAGIFYEIVFFIAELDSLNV